MDISTRRIPSSQQVCTIGGNVAENSGGAHCLKYGFTTHHVLAATFVTADGRIAHLGGAVRDAAGYDLLGVVIGSEGTLGIVTEVVLRIVRVPESTQTVLAAFTAWATPARRCRESSPRASHPPPSR